MTSLNNDSHLLMYHPLISSFQLNKCLLNEYYGPGTRVKETCHSSIHVGNYPLSKRSLKQDNLYIDSKLLKKYFSTISISCSQELMSSSCSLPTQDGYCWCLAGRKEAGQDDLQRPCVFLFCWSSPVQQHNAKTK